MNFLTTQLSTARLLYYAGVCIFVFKLGIVFLLDHKGIALDQCPQSMFILLNCHFLEFWLIN